MTDALKTLIMAKFRELEPELNGIVKEIKAKTEFIKIPFVMSDGVIDAAVYSQSARRFMAIECPVYKQGSDEIVQEIISLK